MVCYIPVVRFTDLRKLSAPGRSCSPSATVPSMSSRNNFLLFSMLPISFSMLAFPSNFVSCSQLQKQYNKTHYAVLSCSGETLVKYCWVKYYEKGRNFTKNNNFDSCVESKESFGEKICKICIKKALTHHYNHRLL